jgi:hypothetical protein
MTIAAPAARGTRCRFNRPTTGDATQATTAATTTGPAIVIVVPSSQTMPKTRAKTPTRSHEVRPTSRSHRAGENAPDSSRSSASPSSGRTPFPSLSAMPGIPPAHEPASIIPTG